MKVLHLFWLIIGTLIVFSFIKDSAYNIAKLPTESIPICDTIRDTVYLPNPEKIPDGCTLSKTEMLTTGEWELNELHRRDENGLSFYKRGGDNSTGINYDRLRLLFRKDGTGIYTDNLGGKHEMLWEFSDAEERSAVLSVDGKYGDKFYWYNIEVNSEYLFSTCPYRGSLLLSTRYQRVKQ
jgi:hypothetical protein